MKHFCLTLLAFAFFVTTATAQDLIWAKQAVSSLYEQVGGWAICHDVAGNVYATGYFSGTTDFEPGPGVTNLTSAGNNDIFIMKFNAQGNFLWVKHIGGAAGNDDSRGISVDASGNIIITGWFTGTVDFDPGAGTANLTSGGAYVCKLTSAGNFVWARAIIGVGTTDMVLDPSGNILVSGVFTGTIDFDPGAGVSNLTSAGTSGFICKLTSAGNFIWAKQLGGCSNCTVRPYQIAVDSANNVVTTGHLSGVNIDFDPGAASFTLSAPGYSPFVSKLDSNGIFVWAKSFDLSPDAYGFGIGVGPNGDVYTTGYFKGTIDTDPGAATNNFTSAGDQDIYVVKLNAAGSLVWAKQLGGRLFEQPTGLATDALDNIYVTAVSDDTMDINNAPMLLIKLNSAGNTVWSNRLNGKEYHSIGTPDVDNVGNMYITGSLRDTTDFDPGNGTLLFTPINVSTTNAFFVKFGNCPSTIATGNVSTTLCAGAAVNVNYTAGCNFNPGNVFTAQLSDASGSFSNPTTIGTRTDTASGVITATIPLGTANGSGYRIRVVSSNPAVTGSDNGSNITIGGVSCPCLPSAPAKQWDARFGSSATDQAFQVLQLPDGGYLVAGVSYAVGVSGDKTQPGQGSWDFWVVRTNSVGTKIFDKTYGGSGYDYLLSAYKTNDGGFLLGGYSDSNISGDKSENSRGAYDYWVVKIDSVGTKQWDKTFGGSLNDLFRSAKQTNDGGYILAGSSRSLISGDKTQGSQGLDDFWVVKINSTGIKQWDYRFGGDSVDYATDILQTTDGGYLVVGNSNSNITGDVTQAKRGRYDYWLVKLNNAGLKQWDKRLGGSEDEDLMSIITTNDGGYALAGLSRSDISAEKSQNSRGGYDWWYVKTDSLGNKIWDATLGSSGNENMYAHALHQTTDGNFLLAGNIDGPISGDVTQAPKGLLDFWLVKLSNAGVKLWDIRLGGSSEEDVCTVIQTSDGGYMIAGSTNSPVSGDITQTSRGSEDFCLIKLSTDAYSASLATGTVASPLCAGATVNVPFTTTCGLSNGNVFTAQLSNASGSFASPVNIGTLTANGSGTISATIPTGTANGSGYRIRVISSNPAVTGSDNGSNITIGGASCTCSLSAPAKQWDVRFGGSDDDDNAIIEQAGDGGFVVAGTTYSPLSGDITEANRGGGDYWLVKTNGAGVKQWDHRFGGSLDDMLLDCKRTTDGGYLLGGYSSSGISGDKTQASQGLFDFWIVKTDSLGVKQWDTRYGGSGGDVLHSMTLTSDGGYLLGGYIGSPVSGDVTGTPRGGIDYWVVKISSSGVKQWDARFGGSGDENLLTLSQTNDGGYILGGLSNSPVSGDKTQGTQGLSDYWIVKINSTGVKQWDARFGGSAGDLCSAIKQTADGGYALYGASSSPASGDKTQGTQGSNDMWLVKINSTGVKQWDYRFGGTGNDSPNSPGRNFLITSDNGFVMTGVSNSPLSGDKTQSSQGGYDYWMVRADANGTKVWDATYGGSADDYPYSVIQANDGSLLIAGASASPVSGDKTQNSQGSFDYWIVKTANEYTASLTTGTVASPLCAGAALSVPFTFSCTANSSNIFTAQLSDASGSFVNPVNIGTLTATGSGSISATIPVNTPAGTGYRIRVVSSNPAVTGTDNGSNITIGTSTTGTLNQSICQGQSYFFNGVSLTTQGTYLDTLVSVAGCDSILTLNLSIKQPTSGSFTATICQGESYFFNGLNRTATGAYLDTLVNAVGCDSILTLNLTVKQTTSGSFSASICQGQSYFFNGGNRTSSGAYLDTLVNAVGCDSILTLNLTVKQTTAGSFSASICQGESYLFNGIARTTAGAYLDTLVNAVGCDSILTLNLTVKQTSTGSITASICQGESYLFNGIARTTAGAYLDTLVNAAGCDSILTLNLTVKQISTGTITASICQGESYTFNGIAHTTSGAYLDTLVNSFGCDSILTLNLTVNPLPAAAINGPTTICSGLSATLTASGGTGYSWDNGLGSNAQVTVTPTNTTTYTVTVTDGNNCSATATQSVSVTSTPTASITGPTQICAGESATLTANGGNTYEWANGLGTNSTITPSPTGTTTYTVTATIGANCSATASHTVTVYQPAASQFNQTICSGQSYTYNGITQTTSGAYLDTLQTVNGCDSVVTLNLTVSPVLTGSFNQAICAGSSYTFNGLTLTQAGTYADTIQNGNGCDSIVTLTLTVSPALSGSFNQAICSGGSFTFNGVALTQAGIYTDTIQNGNGCDSIVTLTLTISNVLTGSFSQAICPGSSYSFNGLQLTQAGTYADTLQTGGGCDSVVTLNLTILPLLQGDTVMNVCEGTVYEFNGQLISAPGNYNDTIPGSNGCDSIVTLHYQITDIDDSVSVTGAVCTVQQNNAGYQWIDCNADTAITGADQKTFTATRNGSYQCIIFKGPCIDTTACVSVTTIGIAEIDNMHVSLYPNPNTGIFTLEFSDNVTREIEVTDAIGKLVLAGYKVEGKQSVNLGTPAAGVYFLRIKQAGKTKTMRFTVAW